MVPSIAMYYKQFIKYQSFIYTRLNIKTAQFSISMQFKCQNISLSNNSV